MATSMGMGTPELTTANTNSNKIDTSKAAGAKSADTKKSNNSLDKDAFLQLLVAQMQYQDPLEPTTNTEYMSQLAQFSSVEELQNINQTFADNRALSLAGQYVILNVPDAAGNINQISGLVDYVTINGGKTYFSINDQYYDSEYLDSVVSLDYLEYISREPENENDTTKTEGENGGTSESDKENDKTEGTDNA
ncbi:MAG: flagellar hook capping FlgD N-terminal domain-containing protein [Clostridiales bacterium]|nr:flagellar hook capping FlgD N-terminal domain-containing protein [Clostridiales bacterium]